MQRIVLILILGVLFSTAEASQETGIDPKEITSAVIEIEISGKIHVVEGVDKIIYTQTFPIDDANQKILSVTSTPEHTITTDEYGNREIVLTWTLPESNALEHRNFLDYTINIQLERTSFPIPYTKTKTEEYLKNDDNLTRWNDDIKNKAAEITTSDNDLIKAAEITNWVNKNIEYDLNFSSTEEHACRVFEIKRGVCDELSRLFIAMARSQGIPARDVAGAVYDGDNWDVHAWAEIYYDGKWIPFDPTYNEMGFVDGTHVIYVRDANNAQINEDIDWEGSKEVRNVKEGIYNEKEKNITILKTNKTKILGAQIEFYDSEISEDTSVNATLEIENLINPPVIGTFGVLTPDEINYIYDREVFYAEPHSKTNLTLNFKVPKMADMNLRYIFPVVVKTFPYAAVESELLVIPKMITNVGLLITPSIIEGPGVVGREIKVNTNIKNRNPTKREFTVNACINGKIVNHCEGKNISLEGNSDKVEEFLFKVPYGNYTLSIKANARGSLDEFTKSVYIGGTTPEEFVEVPYIGKLRIENFFIVVFLGFIIIVVGLLLRRY